MVYKVVMSYSSKSQEHKGSSEIRYGKEIYRHPQNRFVTLEFEGRGGKFRESFYMNETRAVTE